MKRVPLHIHGFGHLTLAVGILLAVGVYTRFPDTTRDVLIEAKAKPHLVISDTERTRACLRKTVESIVGKIGCASASKLDRPNQLAFR